MSPLAAATNSAIAFPGSVWQQAVLRGAIGATALVVLLITWKYLPGEAKPVETTGSSISAEALEISRLRVELASAKAAQQSLRTELDVATRKLGKTRSWHEDTAILNYRSPWPLR